MMKERSNTVQTFWVSLGSLFSFGFAIVSSMIFSRYFLKEDYGTYKQVMYVYNTLLTVFTLGLPRAYSYFLPRVKETQAKSLIKRITNLFFLLGAIFSILLFIFSPQIASFLKNEDLKIALRVFSPVPLLMLPTMGLEGILSTYRKTKFIAAYTITTRVFMLLCVALPVVIFHGNYITAIIGFVIASFVAFLLALYLKYMPVQNAVDEKSDITYKQIFDFSLPLLYASLWGILISSADQFFISRYFGNVVFAEFSNGSLELPFVGMITGASATVLSPIFSRMSHEKADFRKEVFPLWKSVFEKTAKLIYPLVIYCLVFADVLMIALYGQQYEVSAIYFRIRLILNFFTLIIFAPLLINAGKVRFYSNVHMFIAITVIIFEYMSVKTINSPYAISVISLLCQLSKIFILLIGVTKILQINFLQLFPMKLMAQILLPSIVILFAERYLFINLLHWEVWITLFVSFIFYVILYLVVCIVMKINYIEIIKPLFNKDR